MTGDDRANETANQGADAEPACVALVPMTEPIRRSGPPARRSLPDPSFVTQLIATAEHLPQTRAHRRATSADALTAYRACQRKVLGAGLSTRQTA
jgi:hypothetical protein